MSRYNEDVIKKIESQITYIKSRILYNGNRTIINKFFNRLWNKRLRKWESFLERIVNGKY